MRTLVWLFVASLLLVAPISAQTVLVDQCSDTTPGPFFGDNVTDPASVDNFIDTITVLDSVSIGDTQVSAVFTHAFVGDINMTLTSPAAVTVQLHAGGGGADDNMDVVFTDGGIPNAAPYACGGCFMQPAGPGLMADYNGTQSDGAWDLFCEDTFPTSGGGTLDEWCIVMYDAPVALPCAVEALDCNSASGSGVVDMTWTEPALCDNDTLNIYIDGVFIESIPGTDTSYSTPVQGIPQTIEVCIEPVLAGLTGQQVCCSVSLVSTADIEVCSTPGLPIDSALPPAVDVISIAQSNPIGDLQIVMDIAHTFQGDLTVDLLSPAMTMVRMHNQGGGGADNINLTWWELGVPNGSQPYDFGGLMQPSGPGSFLDIINQETTDGDWTLTVTDNIGGDIGTLDEWCVRTFDVGPAFPVGNLDCQHTAGLGIVDVSWTNTSTYDSINIYLNGVLDATLAGTATSYSPALQPVPSTVTICVEGVAGGVATPQVCCTLDLILDAPSALTCTSVSGTGVTDMSWTNGNSYDDINVYADGVLEATIPGASTSYNTVAVPVPSTVTYCIEGVIGGAVSAQTCCTITVILDQPQDIACVANGATGEVTVTWVNPGAYDSIEVFVDGASEAVLGGTETSYTTNPVPGPFPASVTICLEGSLGGGISAQTCCNALIAPPTDIEECSQPGSAISVTLPPTVDIINVGTAIMVGETEILANITHTFQGDLDISVTSPAMTTVQLHDQGGGGDDDINILWSDAGIPNGVPYNCNCAMQPSGPGVLADFMGQGSDGDWTLTIIDNLGGDDGTLDNWCVRINEGCPILAPTDLMCDPSGDNVDLSWSNQATYDSVEILRDGLVIDTIMGSPTSYTDLGPPAGVHSWQVRGVDSVEMCGNLSGECETAVGLAFQACTAAASPVFGDNGVATIQETIDVMDDVLIEDTTISVEMTHAFVGDVIMSVTSPTATNVTLHNGGGGADDNIFVTYTDAGIANAPPYDCNCDMMPAGPGVMADFTGEQTLGIWTIDAEDTFPTSGGGTLDMLCLNVFGDGGGGADEFIRGDCDGDGSFNGLLDGLRALNFQFIPGTPAPPCLDACDFDDSDVFNGLVDGLGHLNFQFVPGSPPPAPPSPGCGPDTTGSVTCDNPPALCNP